MDPYNAEQTRNIWSRVLAGREQGLPMPKQTESQQSAPSQAEPWLLMQRARQAQALYSALAVRLRQITARRMLQSLATDAADRARQLGTICFVQTGRMPGKIAVIPPNPCAPARMLRQLYCQEREEAAQFSMLSGLQPEYALRYTTLAAQARRHMQMILQLLQEILPI